MKYQFIFVLALGLWARYISAQTYYFFGVPVTFQTISITNGIDAFNRTLSPYTKLLPNETIGGKTFAQRFDDQVVAQKRSQEFYNNTNSFSKPVCELVFVVCRNRNNTTFQRVDATNITNVIDKTKPTKIIVHGWLDSHKIEYVNVIGDAWLKTEDVNYCALDWNAIGQTNLFDIAEPYTRNVSDCLAAFIKNFTTANSIPVNSVSCVGHSLGAWICGMTGNRLGKRNGLGECFYLDPSGIGMQYNPMFTGQNGIASDSCGYTQAYITNQGCFGPYPFTAYGIADQVFWIGFGGTPFQIGCGPDPCIGPHYRACYVFAESLDKSKIFGGRFCPDFISYFSGFCVFNIYDRAGAYARKTPFGNFWLHVNKNYPYSQGPPYGENVFSNIAQFTAILTTPISKPEYAAA